MVGVIRIVHFPAHDLAAVQVQDQIEVEPSSEHLRRQVGHVPTPHLLRCCGDVRGWRAHDPGRLGAASVGCLSLSAQHAAEAGFTGQVDALIGQHGHDTRPRYGRKARLVGHCQQLCALVLARGMARHGAHGLRPAIARREPLVGLPPLQGARIDTSDRAGRTQSPRARRKGALQTPEGLLSDRAKRQDFPLIPFVRPRPASPQGRNQLSRRASCGSCCSNASRALLSRGAK